MNVLSGYSGLRSAAAVTVYAAGLKLESCMILAVMLFVRETFPLNAVRYKWLPKQYSLNCVREEHKPTRCRCFATVTLRLTPLATRR